MAQVVFSYIGEAIGSEIGGTILGVSAASIGSAVGTVAGSILENYLLSPSQNGPRLKDVNVQASTEGAPIPRVDGYMRVAGQVIWATKYKEMQGSSGGKGLGGGGTVYTYSISFAVGLCEGVVPKLGRIWADGNLVDFTSQTYGPPTIRFYQGTQDQLPDPLMEEIEGVGNVPAYRGTCYVVFEDLLLTAFGNRIPQLQIELIRSVTADRSDALEAVLTGVNMIPGAGEFVYATTVVIEGDGNGTTIPQNQANSSGDADVIYSLDDLQSLAPNLQTVSVVVGWFGSDLRAGVCTIVPKVVEASLHTYGLDDSTTPTQTNYTWSVAGIDRASAAIVSRIGSFPAYGGTPSDNSVIQLIKKLKALGYKVVFYPFLFMDIPTGNTLPNPYSNNAATVGQPVYPWRGRITCSPAAGYVGSVDKTATAATQISAFFTGTQGFNAMVLHYANLCAGAGGVDSFLIGSELRTLTRTRSDATTFPAVAALKTLAASVKSVFSGAGQSSTKVGYAADWTEYNNYQTGDAAGAVQFNMDPLWSDSNIDFIGIDNYMPLADWRDGTGHLDYDAVNGPTNTYDRAYLQGNIKGGEGYDWYYASQSDRDTQTRTTITDGLGKPWVFRPKDLWNWWTNLHYDRVSGTESGTHTGWVPQSKPIRFTEFGCPAVDKGANQPNVFVDPKSSESALPYYSNGQRDDLVQRAYLEAHLNYWPVTANNPTSTVYAAPMVDLAHSCVWSWDARPYPFFPQRSDLWGDTANYTSGHWLNGRLGSVMLSDLVAEICDESGFSDYDASNLTGLVTGYARTNPMSPRDELTPLMLTYFFDGVESQGVIKFIMRGQPIAATLTEDDLVADPSNGDVSYNFAFTTADEDDLPAAWNISYIDAGNGYQQGNYPAKRLVGNANSVLSSQLPVVMDRAQAGGVGDRLLEDTWIARDTGAFQLPPRFLALDPGDDISITAGGRTRRMRLGEVNDSNVRALTLTVTDPSIYEPFIGPARLTHTVLLQGQTGRALLVFMDLPMLTSADIPWAPHLATFANPWPKQVLLYRSPTNTGYVLDTALSTAAAIGETTNAFYSGPTNRWDLVNELDVTLYNGTLAAADDVTVLGGANVLAVQNLAGQWEILQFANATLTAPGSYKLTRLLRGQLGTEAQMGSPVAAGARVVVLDANVAQSAIAQSQYALPFNYLWGPLGKDYSDPAYQGADLTFQGIGLRPYAPCQVSKSWNTTGDLTIYWIRRDRDPASDSWDQTEIPMSEAAEAYEIDVKDGSGNVLRTITGLSVTSYLYPAAYQVTDFGAQLVQGNTLHLAIYQVSAIFGRGTGKTVTLNL